MIKKLECISKIIDEIVIIYDKIVARKKLFVPLFIIIFIIIIIYFSSRHYFYCLPKEIIKTFYTSLNEQNYDNAWCQLSKSYKKGSFMNSKASFIIGYTTTKNHEDITIEDIDSSYSPFFYLSNKVMIFKTRYVVEDNIKKTNLTDNGTQAENSFWVQVQEKKSIAELKKLTNRKFKIRRVYNLNITLIKEPENWKIVNFKKVEVGLELN